MRSTKIIGVFPEAAYHRSASLWSGLFELEGVRFQPFVEESEPAVEALLLIDVPLAAAEQFGAQGLRVLLLSSSGDPFISAEPEVQFSHSSFLNPILRGRRLSDPSVARSLGESPREFDVLASKQGRAIWTRHSIGTGMVDLLSAKLPADSQFQYLYEYFQRGSFMTLLPLIHFVREVAGEQAWHRPCLRACFMFDDPNLHWPSFGYLNYRNVIESAKRNNYHVAFATIPLDCWFVHKQTARLFHDDSDRVSLLVHGNNHTKNELARSGSQKDRLCTAVQALKRIEKFERRSSLKVAKVMAAPHGACNREITRALLDVGFQAACISRGSLMAHNPDFQWPVTFGLSLAEFLEPALPIIPRFRLAYEDESEIILAAFLGQAIILVGHHKDLRDGVEVLEQRAGLINSLGPIHWMNVVDIICSSYLWRSMGNTAHIRNFSRKLRVNLPGHVKRVFLEPAWETTKETPTTMVQDSKSQLSFHFNHSQESLDFGADGTLGVRNGKGEQMDYRDLSSPPHTPWPLVRRLLTEGRDRLTPFFAKGARASSR